MATSRRRPVVAIANLEDSQQMGDLDRDVNIKTKADANSAWTFGTLYLHLNEKIAAVEQRGREARVENDRRYEQRQTDNIKALGVALDATILAIEKSEAATDSKFKSVNEFREALSDLSAHMIPRAEVDTRFISINDKFIEIRARIERAEGRGAGSAALFAIFAAGVGAIGVITSVVLALLNFAHR